MTDRKDLRAEAGDILRCGLLSILSTRQHFFQSIERHGHDGEMFGDLQTGLH